MFWRDFLRVVEMVGLISYEGILRSFFVKKFDYSSESSTKTEEF